MRTRLALIALAILAAPAAPAAEPPAPDFHALFEERCLSCHGHAGAFARAHLTLRDGVVRDRLGRDVRRTLARHHGGLTAQEIDLFVRVFARQIEADGLYEEKCGKCHASARDLARDKLLATPDGLVGRYTGRDIGKFLLGHGRIDADQAAALTEALRAILLGAR